jgi:IS5 family transposase
MWSVSPRQQVPLRHFRSLPGAVNGGLRDATINGATRDSLAGAVSMQVQGDRAYDSQPHRQALAGRGIRSLLARRNTQHGSGLGKTRWVVERTLAWLHRFRRLKMRYESHPFKGVLKPRFPL